MFTGIVQELGTALAVKRSQEVERLTIHAPKSAASLVPGESVAINGVCLSVVRVHQGALTFEVIPETRRLTNLGKLSVGDHVNIEKSLTLSDRLNGHIVLGHIDGLGKVVRRDETGGDVALDIQVDRALRRYLVPKGPVAVDGASLTVGSRLSQTSFTVFLIPGTVRQTTLGFRRVGDLVNVELDYLAKLMWQFARSRREFVEGSSGS